MDAAGLGADVGLKYADCLKDWNLSKFITLRSPMLRNVDDYGVVGGMVKNTVDLLVTNVKTGLTSKSSTIRWGFFLPLSDAIKEITTFVEEGKVSALNMFTVTQTNTSSVYVNIGSRGKKSYQQKFLHNFNTSQ